MAGSWDRRRSVVGRILSFHRPPPYAEARTSAYAQAINALVSETGRGLRRRVPPISVGHGLRNSSRQSVIVLLPVVTAFLRSVTVLTGVVTALTGVVTALLQVVGTILAHVTVFLRVVTVFSGGVTVFFPLVNVRAGGKIDPDSGFRHFASTLSRPAASDGRSGVAGQRQAWR